MAHPQRALTATAGGIFKALSLTLALAGQQLDGVEQEHSMYR
jgi:hypothetical protein